MGTCVNHPDRETGFLCMKHEVYMCEECLKCRDPEIYCKFRSSCMIWFIHKQKKREEREKLAEAAVQKYKVTFKPDNKFSTVSDGATLLEAAQEADVPLNASCNGKGSCGKCKLILESGDIKTVPSTLLDEKEKGKNYVLACQSTVHGDVTVRVPEENIERKLRIAGMGKAETGRLKGLVRHISPMLVEIPLELTPPTLDDSVSDLDRLKRGLRKSGIDTDRLSISLSVMRDLATVMREENWKITASVVRKKCSDEILRVEPGNGTAQLLGLSIDIGTTSIVAYLVDMSDGSILAAASGHNRQAVCGDDVINRIVCSEKNGVKKLSTMALATINGLISEAVGSVNANSGQIRNVVLSGNTTMIHLLLQIEPRYIRREPYIPAVSEFPILKAGDIGLKVNPMAAVFVMPSPAGYVGGDIVSGLLYAGFHRETPLTLFIDVGTNGEIVLGNKEWLMTASCSAGPAFEGGGVRWGMRAEEGAIEKVSIDPETLVPEYSTVGDFPARGICGSGMIDLIAEMLLTGVIDQSGKFVNRSHPRIKQEKEVTAYIVEFADHTGIEEDIIFTESDIDNIIRSKAAVYAGFIVLLNHAGLDFSMVDKMIITGGFGQYLNIERAVTIGLLPDIERSRFQYLGNSSVAGAYMALMSDEFRKEAGRISNSMTYIDFSSNSRFMDEFTSALFLPHTDMKAFPSVNIRR